MRPSLDLYPPVEAPKIPTWEDILRLSHHEPIAHLVATLVERGDVTREQALMIAVFALYNQKADMFRHEVNRRNMEP